MNRNKQPQKNSLRQKIYIFLTLLGMMCIIYAVYVSLRSQRIEDIEFVKKDFGETKGIVIKKDIYKGRSITVRYKVDGKFYEESDGIDENENVEEGDSINLKYSKTKPKLMMTMFNDDY